MKRILAAAAVLLLIAGAPALAQQEEGDSELQIQGAFFIGGPTDSGSAFINWGRFYSERLEGGLNAALSFNSDGDIGGFGGPFARWNFATQSGTTVPYVGASANVSFGDFSSGDVLLNFEAGVRYFLKRNVAFNVAAQQSYDVDTSEFSDITTVSFGFSYLWGK